MSRQGRRGPYLTDNSIVSQVDTKLVTFGQHLRAWRERKRKTQDEAAQLVGIARSQLAQYETGRRHPLYATWRRFVKAIPEAASWPGIW